MAVKPERSCYNCFKTGHFRKNCSNERACKVCKEPGHLEGSEECKHYSKTDAIVFSGEEDPLSNFYKLQWAGKEFTSTEQIYQYEKALRNHRPDVAVEIEQAEKPSIAKSLSKKIYTEKNWERDNKDLMKEILMAKAEQLQPVRDILLTSGRRLLVEAVPGQRMWSSGLTKEAAANTDPHHFPGENILGRTWMTIRTGLIKRQENNGKRLLSEEDKEVSATSRFKPNGTTPSPKSKNNKHA